MVAAGRTLPEKLAVHGADGLGVLGRGDVHPGPHHVVERGPRLGQCRSDDVEAPAGLSLGAVRTAATRLHRDRACARDEDTIRHPEGAAEADGGLEGRA